MNICFFTSDVVNPVKGGVERVVYNLSIIFRERGHNVICLSRDKSECVIDDNFSLKNNVDVFCDENKEYVNFLMRKYNIDVIIYASHHIGMFDLAKFVKIENNCKLVTTLYVCPDAPLKSLKDDLAIAKFSKKPLYLFLLYLFFGYRYFLRLRYLKKRYLYLYNNSDAFVLESELYIEKLQKIISIKNQDKLYGFPNPMSECLSKGNEHKKKKQILYIARMNLSQKRPDRMLRIWKSLYKDYPEWKLLMVGDGDDKMKMIEYAKKLKLQNVEFIGHTILDELYSESEIFCMTSTYEGFGLVLIESLQNAVIPIAFKSYYAIEEIIEHGTTGFLVSPFSEKSYVNYLSLLMSDFSMRENMRGNILKINFDDRYGKNVIYEHWINLLQKI